mgnify:FL=1
MKDIIIDTLVDALKILPFLFITFLLLELLEHKLNNKTKNVISKSGKVGPIIGSLLGVIPQCGFSVVATNLYITRVISLGTLFSIYLSTSDEMLPIMLSQNVSFKTIIVVLLIKVITGMLFGFIIDLVIRKNNKIKYDYHICEEEHCHCDHGIVKSSLKHTFNIIIFIIGVSFILNVVFLYCGNDLISKIFMKDTLFGPFLGSLVGLIPNCGASVILTEMFLKGAINLGTCMAGLLTGSGVALLVLFKSNKNIKENLCICLTLYLIGVLVGIFIEFIGILI